VEGDGRARFILETLLDEAGRLGLDLPQGLHTAYLNTIPAGRQPAYPGDRSSRAASAPRCAGTPWPW